MRVTIPGSGEWDIATVFLDLNGTLCIDGKLVEGVGPAIGTLREKCRLILCSGDTRGTAAELSRELGIEYAHTPSALAKADLARAHGAERSAAVGNGLIDYELMRTVRLGVAVMQAEGVHQKTLQAATVVVPTVNDALQLFIDEKRLIATLRC